MALGTQPDPPEGAKRSTRPRTGWLREDFVDRTRARAATLNQLLGDTGVKITPDERSNSVLARGSGEELELVERLVQRLDDK